jgi:hypothetical protein
MAHRRLLSVLVSAGLSEILAGVSRRVLAVFGGRGHRLAAPESYAGGVARG